MERISKNRVRVAQFVNVNASVHYASVAMIELAARHADNDPVTIREIARRHRIPAPFLTQILRTLRSAGLVRSIRGAGGGYRLATHPDDITLWDIVSVIAPSPTDATGLGHGGLSHGESKHGGSKRDAADPADHDVALSRASSGTLGEIYERAFVAQKEVFEGETLSDIVTRTLAHRDAIRCGLAVDEAAMYFI